MDAHETAKRRLPALAHFAPAPALGTVADRCARLRPAAVAAPAHLRARQLDLRLKTKGGLLETELQIVAQVRTLARRAPPARFAGAAEKHIEDVVEATKATKPAEVAKGVKPPGTLAPGSVEGRVAEAVVLGTRLGIRQDFIGLADLFKLRLRLGVVFVDVRVILPGEATICFFDLL